MKVPAAREPMAVVEARAMDKSVCKGLVGAKVIISSMKEGHAIMTYHR
jgi:hypothetical protein